MDTQHASLPPFVEALPGGVYTIDTGFHRDRFDAAYLVLQGGRAAFVDCGTNHAVPRLLAALEALGLPREAVDHVIPTHVHLDHAGGAGLLMQELPQATLWVHPRGVRHMVDPSALYAGALAVYGAQEMERSYGRLLPIPATRVQATHDGQTLMLADRPLRFADTPGHARHHHCIWDEVTRGWFTGDTFGLSYREFDSARGPWIVPTTTPVQFEPEALQTSVRRLLAETPDCVYLTHYGRVGDVQRLGVLLLGLLDELVAMGRRLQHLPQRHQALKAGQLELFCASLAEHGVALSREDIAGLLAIDLELNAQGLAIWLDRDTAEKAAASA
jgi:glyoxylase-like metal-dependent hydrolase (beta-lactamase superfamily II)